MPVDPHLVQALARAALQMATAAERAAYLDLACAGDENLRRQVEELLKAYDAAGNDPALKTTEPQPVGRVADEFDLGKLDAPPPSRQLSEAPGSSIGPYKLLQKIGEGGMGTVWMAEQHEPVRRKVALKVIKPGMDSAEILARFDAERQALALMDHPNIAKVLDAGTTETGRPYFAMELVKGVPITRYCDEHQLTPRERLELFVQVCQAIQHAHQKGIIHRDLKPSNVLVASYDGRPVPKVIDFGVAKAMGQQLTQRTLFTGFGGIVGTLEYMSPEQAEFNALDIDTRSDIYSLGVLLYELLTGTTPLTRQRLKESAITEVLRLIREEEPPRPSTRLSESKDSLAAISAQRKMEPAKLRSLIRGELDWIVMKALEKDRTRRYETANGLARDIQRYLADEAVEACPPSAGYKLRKFARRYKNVLIAGGAFAALLIVGILVSTWFAMQATIAEHSAARQRNAAIISEQKATTNAQTAERERDEARTAREDLRRTLYATDMNLIQTAWEGDNVPRVLELLKRQVPKQGQADLRGFEWYYWDRLCHAELRTVKLQGSVDRSQPSTLLLNADGTRIAALVGSRTAQDRQVKVWDTAGGKELLSIPLSERKNTLYSLVFSADGTRLATWTSRFVGAAGRPQPGEPKGAVQPGELKIWDAASGKELLAVSLPRRNSDDFYSAALNSDGTRLVTVRSRMRLAGLQSEVKVWDGVAGKELLSIPTAGYAREAVFSPDGTRVAAVVMKLDAETGPLGKSNVQVWNAATGKELLTIEGASRTFYSLAFSRDGRRIASGSSFFDETGDVHVWDAATGKELLTIPEHSGRVRDLLFSPDGNYLAGFGGNPTVRAWDVNPRRAGSVNPLRLTLKGHAALVTSVAFSLDGSRVYSAARDGTLKVWDATINEESPAPKRPAARFAESAISPDGKRIAQFLQSEGSSAELKLLDTAGKELHSFQVPFGHSHGMAFSPDGTRFATAWHLFQEADKYELKVWDTAGGKELFTIVGGEATAFNGVAFSPDGTRVASTFSITDKESEGQPLINGGVKAWDATSGKELVAIERGRSYASWRSVVISPDGSRIAASALPLADDGETRTDETVVLVWDVATGKEVLSLKGPGHFADQLTFSPDGSLLAAVKSNFTDAGEIHIWDAATGQARYTLKGHASRIGSVVFSPDSRRIVSAASSAAGQGELKVWDAANGQELLTLKSRASNIDGLRFSPDGRRLISTGQFFNRPRDVIQVWDATPRPE